VLTYYLDERLPSKPCPRFAKGPKGYFQQEEVLELEQSFRLGSSKIVILILFDKSIWDFKVKEGTEK
jgi:hypothetical protein